METFSESYGLKNFIKVPTFYENTKNSTGIDLILTNSCLSFQNSGAIGTGLFTVIEVIFQKSDAKIIHYRYYQQYCNDNFR